MDTKLIMQGESNAIPVFTWKGHTLTAEMLDVLLKHRVIQPHEARTELMPDEALPFILLGRSRFGEELFIKGTEEKAAEMRALLTISNIMPKTTGGDIK